MKVQSKRYSDEEIRDAVKNSQCWREVIFKLNPDAKHSASQSHLKNRAIKAKIDFSHFHGQRWAKGKKIGSKRPIEEYLVLSVVNQIKSNCLKKRLIREGLKAHKCEGCGLETWLGKKIPIHLHHKDRNPLNNILENLEILCPNCHALEHQIELTKVRKEKTKQKYRDREKAQKCLVCGSPAENKYCSYVCTRIALRKADWPNKETLQSLIDSFPMTTIGKKFGVSDNSVRKWCKFYKIDCSKRKFLKASLCQDQSKNP